MADKKTYNLSVVFRVLNQATGPLRQVSSSFQSVKGPIANIDKAIASLARNPSWENIQKQARRVGEAVRKMAHDAASKVSEVTGRWASGLKGFMRGSIVPMLTGGGLFGIMAKQFADFDTTMRRLRATLDLSDAKLQEFRELAKKAGRETPYSMDVAAATMLELALNGTKADDVMKALMATLRLAAATGLDPVAEAVPIVDGLLDGFRMTVEEANRAVDVLTNAMEVELDIRSLGKAFKFSGPSARRAGMDFAYLTAMLALMSKEGIEGRKAGMSMTKIIDQMSTPTEKQVKQFDRLGIRLKRTAKGSVDVNDAFKQLMASEIVRRRPEILTEVFGPNAGLALAAVIEQAEDLDEVIGRLQRTGSAAEQVDARMSGLTGAMNRLKNKWVEFRNTLIEGEAAEAIGEVLDKLGKVLDKVGEFIKARPGIVNVGMAIVGVTAVVTPLLWAMSALASITTAAAAAMLAFDTAAAPVIIIIAGITAALALLGLAVVLLVRNWDMLPDYFSNIWKRIQATFADGVAGCLELVDLLSGGMLKLQPTIDALRLGADALRAQMKPVEWKDFGIFSGMAKAGKGLGAASGFLGPLGLPFALAGAGGAAARAGAPGGRVKSEADVVADFVRLVVTGSPKAAGATPAERLSVENVIEVRVRAEQGTTATFRELKVPPGTKLTSSSDIYRGSTLVGATP